MELSYDVWIASALGRRGKQCLTIPAMDGQIINGIMMMFVLSVDMMMFMEDNKNLYTHIPECIVPWIRECICKELRMCEERIISQMTPTSDQLAEAFNDGRRIGFHQGVRETIEELKRMKREKSESSNNRI